MKSPAKIIFEIISRKGRKEERGHSFCRSFQEKEKNKRNSILEVIRKDVKVVHYNFADNFKKRRKKKFHSVGSVPRRGEKQKRKFSHGEVDSKKMSKWSIINFAEDNFKKRRKEQKFQAVDNFKKEKSKFSFCGSFQEEENKQKFHPGGHSKKENKKFNPGGHSKKMSKWSIIILQIISRKEKEKFHSVGHSRKGENKRNSILEVIRKDVKVVHYNFADNFKKRRKREISFCRSFQEKEKTKKFNPGGHSKRCQSGPLLFCR
ncbi:hypothetical protein CEXT_742461 [Caerostris extrusa]|uniref:Uncharacterized protein n=1 Tax=Caerostris extrusa TaxID=172846 RepID=A0AAV4Y175_CAEEX|nr:hypothetical protein CEXT_742461 [Caerostris extrusa]